jgi:DNA processing protein
MEQLLAWLLLKNAPGVGNRVFKELLERFGHPDEVIRASQKALLAVRGVTPRTVAYLKSKTIPQEVLQDLEAAKKHNVSIVTLSDENYPAMLTQIPDPPPFLYVRGEIFADDRAVAVVGARNASQYGLQTANRLARELADCGVTVVSGMARGIDTAAHEGAVSAKGRTIAVAGCGLSRVYPPENKELFEAIAATGAVISELAMNAPPHASHFPARNRIISGLCVGIVVVEAAARSGSLITARMALDQNREVMAVPGSVTSFKSAGTHSLIKQGAALVENARDVLAHLAGPLLYTPQAAEIFSKQVSNACKAPSNLNTALTDLQKKVLLALGPYPVQMDELCRELALPVGELAAALLEMEIMGLVFQEPGKMFSRKQV